MDDGISNRITTYSYDPQNRVVDVKVTENGTQLHTFHYSYNEEGLPKGKTVKIGTQASTQTSYTYDAQHRIYTVMSAGVLQYAEYNDLGLLSNTAVRSGNTDLVVQQYTYSSMTELSEYRVSYGARAGTYIYGYDDWGNITQITINSPAFPNAKIIKYTYDDANQLVREDNEIAGYTWVMTYDDAGNILSRKKYSYATGTLGGELSSRTLTYGSEGWGDVLATVDGINVSSDSSGNILYDGASTYTWENGRQLATATKGGTTWWFTYDASGMRTERTNVSTTYRYTYEGTQLVQMTVGNNTLIFTYGINDQPMSVNYNGTDYYYITNVQGDVVGILNVSGTEVVTYSYDAWGNVLSTGGTMAGTLGAHNPLRYRGYVYDRETGLYYLQSRYYNPTICRFINADVYVSTGQNILGYNMFAYCNNNPVMRYDPNGEIPVLIAIALGIIAIAATINDIMQIPNLELEGISSTDNGDKTDNVRIKDSYRILTPWMQYGYGFYLNHINEQTRDIIDGTTIGVTYEWMVHNVAYAATFIPGLDRFKTSAESVDIGKTVFADPHEGFMGYAMKIPYLLLLFPVAVVDLFINGGYR